MEFINATKKFQDPNFEAVFKNNTKNTSITVVKMVQNLDGPSNEIKFDITL